MPDFDITMPVTLTFRVEAADAEKAAWAMRHAFDSRHAGDPMAGLSMSLRHVGAAKVMVCSFDANDREAVTVETI